MNKNYTVSNLYVCKLETRSVERGNCRIATLYSLLVFYLFCFEQYRTKGGAIVVVFARRTDGVFMLYVGVELESWGLPYGGEII